MKKQTSKTTVSETQSPEFENLVQHVLDSVDKQTLEQMRKDFHTRLRITLTQPDSNDLIEDLWDYFYDWCFFEKNLPETAARLETQESDTWKTIKGNNQRGLYVIQKATDDGLKLKELFSGETYQVNNQDRMNTVAFSKGAIVEARLGIEDPEAKKKAFFFLRKPCHHPEEIHPYIKAKIKDFKKAKDFSTYQNWLWLLVGMYLKHRLYTHLPIEKIYDDNSRI